MHHLAALVSVLCVSRSLAFAASDPGAGDMHARLLPTLFVPHGGGPMPILGCPHHATMNQFLTDVPARLQQKPTAILLISAHWEESEPQLTSAPLPGLLYDYYGFPEESYSLKYPAAGDPQLAARAADLLRSAGFAATLNPKRALDHGAFIPLKMMFPAADIPVVQLSLKASLDPQEHYAMGSALAPLRAEGVLLLGSGMSFHNMGLLRGGMHGGPPRPGRDPAERPGYDFQSWLLGAVQQDPQQRQQLLAGWATAPGARVAHPREEHLLPLMVVAGAASGAGLEAGTCGGSQEDAKGHVLFDGEVMGAAVAGVAFGQLSPETS